MGYLCDRCKEDITDSEQYGVKIETAGMWVWDDSLTLLCNPCWWKYQEMFSEYIRFPKQEKKERLFTPRPADTIRPTK